MEIQDLSDVLSEFARTMVRNFPVHGFLDHLVKRIVGVMPITAAGVTLIAPGLEQRHGAASDPSALHDMKLETEWGEGPCRAACQTAEAIAVPDLRLENRFPRFSGRALESGLSAVFTFPLRHDGAQIGALDLYRDAPGPLSPAAMTGARTLADVAAAYLINAQARSDLQHSSDQLPEASLHDALTGLPNRALMLEHVEHAFAMSRRSKKISAVFFIDLDGVKEVNDAYGHRVGNELLTAVAQRLTEALRPGDVLARLSGDEFVILCEDLADQSGADPIAVRLAAELARPFVLSGREVNSRACIGVAFLGAGVKAPEELFRDADRATYRSTRGRIDNPMGLREPHLAGYRAGLARSLPEALARGELHLDDQPSSFRS